ncbi:hypothetical protein BGZ83_000821 [Gryganskiella cystojenkinii]|nr:hypothetical protein BGZ83_000821 [Gryganskiella cystojenkinii]
MSGSGYGLSGAASMFGASISSGLHQLMSSNLSISGHSPSLYFGEGYPFLSKDRSKRYSQTVRSSASSILSLNRASKPDPPVAIMPHYNSPYENFFYGQSELHDRDRQTPQFNEIRALYPKKDDFQPMLHFALKECLESVPEIEVNRRQAFSSHASDVVVSEPGWVKSPLFILSLVKNLQEVKGEAFNQVMKNMEALMKPPTLMIDFVVPDSKELNSEENPASSASATMEESFGGLSIGEQDRFWNFFKSLGDPIENELFEPVAAKTYGKSEVTRPGSEPEEYLQDAINELISTERTYNQQLRILVNTFLAEAQSGGSQPILKGVPFPLSKYEVRAIFFNAERLLELSTAFLSELSAYEESTEQQRTKDLDSSNDFTMNLGEICQRNLASMGCYRSYLINHEKAIALNIKASKRMGYDDYQDRCMRLGGTTKTLASLLSEPFQRISRYPMIFKSIIMRSRPGSDYISGLQEAASLASKLSYMEDSFVDKTGFILRYLTDKIEHSPRDIFSSTRTILGYLDGFESNLLTGERGRAICLILFSDKIMIIRRPPSATSSLGPSSSGPTHLSGEVLFPAEFDEKGNAREPSSFVASASATAAVAGHGRRSSYPGILKSSNWKFMGWRDILNLKVVCMEQTDPEGLFCMTSIHHQILQQVNGTGMGSTEDCWDSTRGILPVNLKDRDRFISKFNSALAIAKAKAAGNSEDWTARLQVGDLEVVCNVFTESQYRQSNDQKGDVALFYAPPISQAGTNTGHPSSRGTLIRNVTQNHQPPLVDLTSFKRLPQFVGLIQTSVRTSSTTLSASPNLLSPPSQNTGSNSEGDRDCSAVREDRQEGFRVVLKSKASLNGLGNSDATTEIDNRFLDLDAFQTHVIDLVANLHLTAYNFDPYQSAQLHFSRLYMDGADQYLLGTVCSSFSRSKSVRARGSGGAQMHRDAFQAASSSPTQFRPHYPPQLSQNPRQNYGGGGPLSPTGNSTVVAGMSSPNSPSGGLLGRSLYNSNYAENISPLSPMSRPARRLSILPTASHLGATSMLNIRQKRADSIATVDSVESADTVNGHYHQPPPLPRSLYNQPQLEVQEPNSGRHKIKSSISVMNLLLPGRKKVSAGLLSSMVFTGQGGGGLSKSEKKSRK